MPVKMKEAYYKPVFDDLQRYFYNFYWADIFDLLDLNKPRLLNSTSALLSAIRAGTVTYENGVFRGTFDARISRELSRFATFDGRRKLWTGIAPSDVRAAAVIANDRAANLAQEINRLIDEMPARVEGEIANLTYPIEDTLFAISDQAGVDLRNIGIDIDITPELSERLIRDYTNNQNLNIKNWTGDQIIRLRDMIQKNALQGYNREELQQMIMAEFQTTMNKARFLARQETSLFMATVRDERYQSAGVRQFRWSATNDGRTRELHRELHGQVFTYGTPPIIDERTGERGYPGQAFGCRCAAIPIL